MDFKARYQYNPKTDLLGACRTYFLSIKFKKNRIPSFLVVGSDFLVFERMCHYNRPHWCNALVPEDTKAFFFRQFKLLIA